MDAMGIHQDVPELLCYDLKKARPIRNSLRFFRTAGNEGPEHRMQRGDEFTADEWNKSKKEQEQILMNYRIAYPAKRW